jgi:S1-C subfamily serine protease
MRVQLIVLRACVALFCVLILVSLAPAAAPGDVAAEYEHVLKTHRDALVTIKFVQKTQGQFGDSEGENEINGVMVEPGGLVLCSNALLGGSLGRRSGRSVPTDIKVLIGEDTEGVEARFIARDSELDLAWLQIKEPGDRKFACVDVAAAAKDAPKLRLADRLLTLGVMGRYYGQEILVSEGVIAGKARKPRELYVVRGSLDTDPGLPVFTPDGKVAGFACLQAPDPEEITGNVANLVARGRGLILPVETVARATKRAKEVKAEDQPGADEATPTMRPAKPKVSRAPKGEPDESGESEKDADPDEPGEPG